MASSARNLAAARFACALESSVPPSFPDKERFMDQVEPGIPTARMQRACLQHGIERPRLVRWAMFDKNTVPAPSGRYCWLDCETGRLVFSESKEHANA